MSTKEFKWGILAPGRIAKNFAAGLTAVEDASLFAVASRSKERAEEFAGKYNASVAYGSYQELLADPNVDAVYIASLPPFHKEITIEALKAGKPVLCEKPFAVNYFDSLAMVEAARENDTFLMEAMWTRFFPVMKEIKQKIANGDIGRIKTIRADFSFLSDLSNKDDRWLNKDLGGGALLDVGIYPISITCYMMGELPTEVSGIAEIGDTGVDEQDLIHFRFKSGTTASLTAGVTLTGSCAMDIIGEKGIFRIPKMFHCSSKYALLNTKGKVITEFNQKHLVNGYEFEAMEVASCVRAGEKESSIMPLDETLAIMKIMDNLRASWGLFYPGEGPASDTVC